MSEWLDRARPWLNSLLVFLLLLPVAQLSWRFFVPAEKKAASNTTTAPAMTTGASRARLDLTALRQAMLFGQANTTSLNGQLPESTLSIKLQGVIAAGESPSAVAIFDSGEPKLRAVSVGMTVSPDVILKAVFKDHAVITNRGRDERLSLQTPPAMSLNSPPAMPTNPSGIERYPNGPLGAPPPGMNGYAPPPAVPMGQMNEPPPGYNGDNNVAPNRIPRY